MENILLQIEKLRIGYQSKKTEKTVASNLNANLRAGQMICLLGSNGRGKSTLMRTLCAFLKPLQGKVLLKNKLVSEYSEKELSKLISVVLTDRIMLPQARVKEVVGFGRSPYTGLMGKLHAEDKEKVEAAMETCHIAFKKNDYYSDLSDGEKQKVNIARALAQDTPIIILDEPTAFLDLASSVEVMLLLRKLASEENKAILMSTHNLDLALQLADRLWLLEKDGPMLTGSPEDLLINKAFQEMFDSPNVKFDEKTGLFKVNYHAEKQLTVKGHGFRYVLLRRALARKGFAINKNVTEADAGFDVRIPNNEEANMSVYFDNFPVEEFNSMEKLVNFLSINYSKDLKHETSSSS